MSSWPTPWTERTVDADFNTPWGVQYTQDRVVARQNFFRDLEAAPVDEPQAFGIPATDDEQPEGTAALSQLPWEKYEKTSNLKFKRAFLWPVANGRISSGFGVRGSGFHEGVDIPAPMRTPVKAAADGRVVFSGSISGYGKTTVIYHGDGISTIYAHHSQNMRSVGEVVRQGDIIGSVGTTGRTRGSHLHFEVRRGGRAINPLSYSYTRHPLLSAEAKAQD